MSRIKLVIADDDTSFRVGLVRFLSNFFDILDSVADGGELINSATLVNPDVIVSDVYMPVFTGPEAMNQLYADGIKIPFVFISAGENIFGDHISFVPKDKVAHQLVPAILRSASTSLLVLRGSPPPDGRFPGTGGNVS
jgi:CheY-like chemotaxis protein